MCKEKHKTLLVCKEKHKTLLVCKEKHKTLLAQVGNYAAKYKEGNTNFSHESLSFMKNWLTKHIMGIDQKYASFLKEKMGQ